MIATPDNAAVVTVLAYQSDQVPHTYGFMYQSAQRLGIQLHVFGRNEAFESFLSAKIVRLHEWIAKLPDHFTYVLFVDAKDVLFARSLQAICDEYNALGAPILMSSELGAYPGRHMEWEARFPKFESGFNFHNTGGFIGRRDCLQSALMVCAHLATLVRDGVITLIHQNYWSDDQALWQLAAIMRLVPVAVDHEQRVFFTASIAPYSMYNFGASTVDAPIVLTNGAKPCVLHFSGPGSCAIPFAAWTLGLAPVPNK